MSQPHEWIQTSDPMTPMCGTCRVRDGDPRADASCPGACVDCGGSGYTRRVGWNNDEIVENCSTCSYELPRGA